MILFLPFILHCDNAEDVFPDIFGFSSEPFVLLTVVGEKKKSTRVRLITRTHGRNEILPPFIFQPIVSTYR